MYVYMLVMVKGETERRLYIEREREDKREGIWTLAAASLAVSETLRRIDGLFMVV